MVTLPVLSRHFYILIKATSFLLFLAISQIAFSQNVGIGTLTPEDKLHLLGNLRVSGGKIFFVNTGRSVFVGDSAGLHDDLSDNRNVFIGHRSGMLNTSGALNVALGHLALNSNLTGNTNVAIGGSAGEASLGHSNTYLGYGTGATNVNGVSNVFIGAYAGLLEMGSDKLYISNSATSTPLLYGDFLAKKLTVHDTLVAKSLYLTYGAYDGYLLQSDVYGRAHWVHPHGLFNNVWDISGDNIFNNNFENVGIGTASPADKLHILGDLRIEGGRINFLNAHNSTFLGQDAGLNEDLENRNNTFIGFKSGENTLAGWENTAMGSGALYSNVNGFYNVAIGREALKFNNSSNNTAVGGGAGKASMGTSNTFLGADAGANNTGSNNIFLGSGSGALDFNGNDRLYIDNSNTSTPLLYGEFDKNKLTVNDSLVTKYFQVTDGAADGYVLRSNGAGYAIWTDPSFISAGPWTLSGNDIYKNNSGNVGIGTSTPGEKLEVAGNIKVNGGRIGFANTGSSVFIGEDAGINDDLLSTHHNTFIGFKTGQQNITGYDNTAFGSGALFGGTGSNSNVAIGKQALFNNNATQNVAIGLGAGFSGTGSANVFVGYNSGYNNNGNGNIFLGNAAGALSSGSNQLVIDNSNTSTPLLFGEFDQNKLTINDTLVTERFYLTEGAFNGHILKSSAAGRAVWTDPASLFNNVWSVSGNDIYKNNTGNVGINIVTPLERMHVKGSMAVDSGRISILNTGESVFIGEQAGKMDDLTTNRNIYIGNHAGKLNSTGANNIGIGAGALDSAAALSYNIAIGTDVLGSPFLTGQRNTGIGFNTLKANTSGDFNVGIGNLSLSSNTTGDYNVGLGTSTLQDNTTGFANVAIGQNALTFLQNGNNNTVVGRSAGFNQVNGNNNSFFGTDAGRNNNASGNVFLGFNAGYNETGSNKLYITNSNTSTPLLYGEFDQNRLTVNDTLIAQNIRVRAGRISFINTGFSTYVGQDAGLNDILPGNHKNTFIGYQAGKMNIEGVENIAIGADAFSSNIDGDYNIAIGKGTMYNSLDGKHNTAIGREALSAGTNPINNVVLGYRALHYNNAEDNVAVGANAGENATGSRNVFLGQSAGIANTGNNNILIGYQAGLSETGSDKLFIENSNSNTPLIYGEFDKNKVVINDSLSTKYFQLTEGAAANYILKSDASGKASWVNHSAISDGIWGVMGSDIYKVNTGNVGIGTSTPQQPLEVAGNISIVAGRLSFSNTGNSTFVGNNAGLSNNNALNNQNSFIGYAAGQANTSGSFNTALGALALSVNTTGHSNVAIGSNVLTSTQTGHQNTAIGHEAMRFGANVSRSVAVGHQALLNNTGYDNVAVGYKSASNNISGLGNTFLGHHSGQNSSGNYNVLVGYEAGMNETGSNRLYIDNSNTTTPLLYGEFDKNRLTINDTLSTKYFYMTNGASDGYVLKANASGKASWVNPAALSTSVWTVSGNDIYKNNTGNVGIGTSVPSEKLDVVGNINVNAGRISFSNNAQSVHVGANTGLNETPADNNSSTFIGYQAGKSNTTADGNTAVGTNALTSNTTSPYNSVVGKGAMQNNMTGGWNAALGYEALSQGTNLFDNVAIGYTALRNTSGKENVAIGSAAGSMSGGDYNVMIGRGSGQFVSGFSNVFIGYNSGKNAVGSNKLYIENTDSNTPLIYGDFSADKVGINTSLPNSTFEVSGTVGATFKNAKVLGLDQPDGTATYWRYTTSVGGGQIVLPAANICTNRMYVIVNATGLSRTISDYINLSSVLVNTIAVDTSVTLISDGTDWFQVK